MNKKGLAMQRLVTIILALVSLIILSTLIFSFQTSLGSKADENSCRNSVALRAKATFEAGRAKVTTALNCATIDKEVKQTKEKDLQRVLADNMARCWWQFGQGVHDEILTGSELSFAVLGTKSKNDCFVCYTLLTDPKAESFSAESFTSFLRKERYAKTNATYLNYIQSSGGAGRIAILTPEIKPNMDYAVVFQAKNKKSEAGFWSGTKKITGAGGAVIAAGAACTLFSGGVCGVGILVFGGAAAALSTSGTSDLTAHYAALKKGVYESLDRDTSVIILDTTESAQQHCFKGDVRGK